MCGKKKLYAAVLAAVVLLTACSQQGTGRTADAPMKQPMESSWQTAAQKLANANAERSLDEAFLQWCETQEPGLCDALCARMQQGEGYSDSWFYDACGNTLAALDARYQCKDGECPENLHILPGKGPITLAFGGDVNFADDWYNMQHYATTNGVQDCFDPQLLERMHKADILLLNNEFCFSRRGNPLPGKLYTFRADPAHAQMWHELGADLVGLANNHVYDFGPDAFEDTLTTLKEADVPYVGAGRNIQEAMQPQYFVAGGMKIAYVAATRAEKFIMTPAAEENVPGVLRTYDPELTLRAIREAKENSDYVVVYVHWGTEGSTVLEKAQTDLATQYAQAGADLIVGAHTHILQGAGWRGDVPVIYSMGNFWFNMETEDTGLLEVTLSGPDPQNSRVQLIPCIQSGGRTVLADAQNAQRILQNLNTVMESGSYTEDGILQKDQNS